MSRFVENLMVVALAIICTFIGWHYGGKVGRAEQKKLDEAEYAAHPVVKEVPVAQSPAGEILPPTTYQDLKPIKWCRDPNNPMIKRRIDGGGFSQYFSMSPEDSWLMEQLPECVPAPRYTQPLRQRTAFAKR